MRNQRKKTKVPVAYMITIYHFPVLCNEQLRLQNICRLAWDRDVVECKVYRQKKGKIIQRAKKSLTVWPVVKIIIT